WIRGIEDVCERTDYAVFRCNGDDDRERQERSLETLLERRVDGVLLATPTGPASALAKRLDRAKVKTVLVDRNVQGVAADRVRIYHNAGARLAVAHPPALGPRPLACLAGPLGSAASRARVAGWRRGL